jgi:alpha,alpha-trehalase
MMNSTARRLWSPLTLAPLLLLIVSLPCGAAENSSPKGNGEVTKIKAYIASAWDTLTRSMTDCKSVADPKLSAPSVLYLPAGFAVPPAVQRLQQACNVKVENLPFAIHGPGEADPDKFATHGLLYLENPYVVPGGRFNEMYGWDSYFILRGLVEDGRIDLARGMVDNFFFEIEHYGTILNANRTYYLTRAQAPFLSSMIMAIYDAQNKAGKVDRAWLARGYEYTQKDYAMWNREPHLAGKTGLSRYYDFGIGPTPESLQDESGVHRKVAAYFAAHPEIATPYIAGRKLGEKADRHDPTYTIQVCDMPLTMARPECEAKNGIHLTQEYYKGDRAMRESGFDISFRFGPYGAGTHHFAPTCLNSLLYKTEKELADMATILGRPKEAEDWQARAKERAARMQELFWDASRGLFFDYEFQAGKRSDYEYATTFYPLWAGWATPEQARAVAKSLTLMERSGGVAMSPRETGMQWDYPFGWAPLQLITVEGLRKYGLDDDANRVSYEFLSTVLENFQRDGTIREKYNVETKGTESAVAAGYQANVIGFGWTNGAFLVLLHNLPADMAAKLDQPSSGEAAK